MKIVNKKEMVEMNMVSYVKEELKILKKLNHPFVNNFYYSFQTDTDLYFIIEYLSGGELLYIEV